MTAANGRANGSAIDNPTELVAQAIVGPAVMRPSTGPQFSTDQIRELIAELEVPFDPAVIEWRVTNTTKSGKTPGTGNSLCGLEGIYGSAQPLVHSRWLDTEVCRAYQRELRTEARPEDGREGVRDLRADDLRPRITLCHW